MLKKLKGINQNELIYEFILEKSWRNTLNTTELSEWYKLKFCHQ